MNTHTIFSFHYEQPYIASALLYLRDNWAFTAREEHLHCLKPKHTFEERSEIMKTKKVFQAPFDIIVQEKRLSYRIAQQHCNPLFFCGIIFGLVVEKYEDYIQYIRGTQGCESLIYFSTLGLLNAFANNFLPSIIKVIFYFQKFHFPPQFSLPL